ncbi:hypothetical protein K3495_g8163 [Podosphaera aphanis]|nr:hypothetical protein K3495_g8163 [Podosphaera aphanis]
MLCSSLLRCRQTAVLAFRKVGLAVVSNIIALPHLQSIGSESNNTGTSVEDTEKYEKNRLRIAEAGSKKPIPMDVSTFCDQNWTDRDNGMWSSKGIDWRVDFMRGLLSEIWIGCGMKRAEVVVVTHRSFMHAYLGDVSRIGLDIKTCVLNELSSPRVICRSELKSIRAAADKFLNEESSFEDIQPCKADVKAFTKVEGAKYDEKTFIESDDTENNEETRAKIEDAKANKEILTKSDDAEIDEEMLIKIDDDNAKPHEETPTKIEVAKTNGKVIIEGGHPKTDEASQVVEAEDETLVKGALKFEITCV